MATNIDDLIDSIEEDKLDNDSYVDSIINDINSKPNQQPMQPKASQMPPQKTPQQMQQQLQQQQMHQQQVHQQQMQKQQMLQQQQKKIQEANASAPPTELSSLLQEKIYEIKDILFVLLIAIISNIEAVHKLFVFENVAFLYDIQKKQPTFVVALMKGVIISILFFIFTLLS